MCTNGVNAAQVEQMIAMVDDQASLGYRWTHRLAHLVDDNGFSETSELLHTAQGMFADVRAVLDEARQTLEKDARALSDDETDVHLV